MGDGWCPFATKRPIVNSNFDLGRGGQRVIAVVLHIADGALAGVFPTFNDPASQRSAHFCIGKQGEIEQYVSINDTAYGNGLTWRAQRGQWFTPTNKPVVPTWPDIVSKVNPNAYTISIEHEGKPEEMWTPPMYEANNRVMQWIAGEMGIVYVVRRSLIGHNEINPVDRPKCPGPNVQWNRIALDANGGFMPVDQPSEPSVDGAARAAQTSAVAHKPWMPINTDGALYKFALAQKLGYPQTDEFEFRVGTDTYVAQVYNLGIVYVKKGDFANCKFVKKP